MPLRILTDEHIACEVAYRLVELGYEVVPLRDRGLTGAKDWDLMRWLITRHFTMCTNNGRHFEQQHQHCRDRGEDHYGVLIIGNWTTDQIYWALRQYLEARPESSA